MKRIRTSWTFVVNAGTGGLRIYDHRRGICKGVNFLCAVIAAINLTVGPAFGMATGKLSVYIGSIGEALLAASIILLNYHRRYLAASISLFILLNLATLYFGAILGESTGVQIMIVLLVVLGLFLFEKRKHRAIAVGCTVVAMTLMELNLKYKFVAHIQTASEMSDYMRWAADLTVGSLVVLLFNLYDKNNTRLLVKLKQFSQDIDKSLQQEKQVSEKKSQYIRNAYHEVRSQFRFVSMIVRVLHNSNREGKLTPEMLDSILKDLLSGDQVLEMTLINILEYSKFEAGIADVANYEPLNLRVVVAELVNLFSYLAKSKEINIDLEFGSDIEYFVTDRLKLTGIITNLIHNAYKFSNSGSTISINFTKIREKLRITVSDQGKGIPSEKLSHIFEPWFSDRAASNKEGIGLGLGIVKKLVDQLDGTIKVKPNSGVGTAFFVFLPFKDLNTPEGQLVKEQLVKY